VVQNSTSLSGPSILDCCRSGVWGGEPKRIRGCPSHGGGLKARLLEARSSSKDIRPLRSGRASRQLDSAVNSGTLHERTRRKGYAARSEFGMRRSASSSTWLVMQVGMPMPRRWSSVVQKRVSRRSFVRVVVTHGRYCRSLRALTNADLMHGTACVLLGQGGCSGPELSRLFHALRDVDDVYDGKIRKNARRRELRR
jgi:hypothetical protein